MKNHSILQRQVMSKHIQALLSFALCLVVNLSGSAIGEVVSLSDGNLSIEYRDGAGDFADSGGGNLDFVFDGIDYGFGESWLLTNSSGTTELRNGVINSSTTSTASMEYLAGDISIVLDFNVIGNLNSGVFDFGVLQVLATVTNIGAGQIDGTLSNYNDFDMPADPSDDEGVLDGFSPFDVEVNNFQVAGDLFDFSSKRWTSFNNALPDRWAMEELGAGLLADMRNGMQLGNVLSAAFTGNVTGAAEWDFSLAGQESVSFETDLAVFVYSVPEPAASLILLGLIFGCTIRRRRSCG